MILRLVLPSLLSLALLAPAAFAQDHGDGVTVTKKLWASTVTVRMSSPAKRKAGELDDVTVFSGVSLGKGLIVTFTNRAPASWQYRLTLPDGGQADGSLRVLDMGSGLSLVEMTEKELPGLTLADKIPDVGSTLYTAAAAGIDKPVVSRGILSGVDRRFQGERLPPLLQCDVRTTGTSPGAAVVDSKARLVGIIAVNSTPGQGAGWTYAISMRHVSRVRKAYQEEKTIILPEERPSLGMQLLTPRGETDKVYVNAVTPGGPAHKAGVRKGDQLLAVNGQKVRNTAQVQVVVGKLMSGDAVKMSIQRRGELKTCKPVLAAGPATANRPSGVAIVRGPDGQYRVDVTNRRDRQAAGPTRPLKAGAGSDERGSIPRDPAQMKEAQIQQIYKALNLLYRQNADLRNEVKRLQQELKARDGKR